MALKFCPRLSIFFIFSALLGACSEEDFQWSSEDETALSRWLDEERRTPGEIVREVLQKKRSVVLYQENPMRADTVDLVKALVPVFVDYSLQSMALFFVNNSGNFRVDPSLAYSDYSDFLSYLEEFNQISTKRDTPVTWRGLRGEGQISITALQSALEDTMKDRPIFIWLEGRANMATYFELIEDMEYEKNGLSPPILMVHHGPADEQWESLFEIILPDMNSYQKTFAFYSDKPAFPGFRFRDELNGEVIYVVTSFPYRAVKPIKHFISSVNSDMAINYFQDLSIRSPKWWSSWLMNQSLKRQANRYDKFISRRQKKWAIK